MENTAAQRQINYDASMAKADLEFKLAMQYTGLGFITVLAMISIWF